MKGAEYSGSFGWHGSDPTTEHAFDVCLFVLVFLSMSLLARAPRAASKRDRLGRVCKECFMKGVEHSGSFGWH